MARRLAPGGDIVRDGERFLGGASGSSGTPTAAFAYPLWSVEPERRAAGRGFGFDAAHTTDGATFTPTRRSYRQPNSRAARRWRP
jgi:hypothetical protein